MFWKTFFRLKILNAAARFGAWGKFHIYIYIYISSHNARELFLCQKKTKITVVILVFGGFVLFDGGFVNYQEALGLDILVHGEAERTDMVEFFGQQLEGFAFTENGWVQVTLSKSMQQVVLVYLIILFPARVCFFIFVFFAHFVYNLRDKSHADHYLIFYYSN